MRVQHGVERILGRSPISGRSASACISTLLEPEPSKRLEVDLKLRAIASGLQDCCVDLGTTNDSDVAC